MLTCLRNLLWKHIHILCICTTVSPRKKSKIPVAAFFSNSTVEVQTCQRNCRDTWLVVIATRQQTWRTQPAPGGCDCGRQEEVRQHVFEDKWRSKKDKNTRNIAAVDFYNDKVHWSESKQNRPNPQAECSTCWQIGFDSVQTSGIESDSLD